MQNDFSEIERIIGYNFHKKELLKTAFTHSSYSNEHKAENNERLEFLGDSVLGVIVAEWLFYKEPELNAGKMTQEKQKLVSTKPLSEAICKAGLGRYLICGESMNKQAFPRSVLENLCESLIGAIYLDGGFESAKRFIVNFVLGEQPDIKMKKTLDYKSELQVYSQKLKAGTPKYELVSKEGPDHDPLFTIAVEVSGLRTTGSGKSKAEASQMAAEKALKIITGRKS